jgi:hypothetical protein
VTLAHRRSCCRCAILFVGTAHDVSASSGSERCSGSPSEKEPATYLTPHQLRPTAVAVRH